MMLHESQNTTKQYDVALNQNTTKQYDVSQKSKHHQTV